MVRLLMTTAMTALALAFAVATSTVAAVDAAAQDTGVPGGWSRVDVASSHEHALLNALAKRDANSAPHICVTQLTAVEQQVVAGMNYRFHVQGCRVKPSADGKQRTRCRAPCTLQAFVVQVWEQSWTDTLEVTSIEDESMAANEAIALEAREAISEEEKAQILQWIKDKGLNEFGDSKSTMYTGGTPLFNETSGQSVDRFEYIIKHHPGRPWANSGADMHMNGAHAAHVHGAKPLELAAASESTKSNTNRDIAIAGGTFTVLGALVVLVAFSKRRQAESRRFTYETVPAREL
ncbi:hypothetical protein P43SY_006101 [Pythium insidiosum]|uniref:Cystatin domain-containing protein n=1 Tax=Pythium insidiosum TaxID=114742 RepID=A0AAD5M259_PYTIN|nr:hypothetical protein P43SY_006101 [Pythium insidiosum]